MIQPTPSPAEEAPPAKPASRARAVVSLLVKLAIVAGIFGYLIYNGSISRANLSDLLVRWPWTLLALAMLLLPLLLVSLRYKLLLTAMNMSARYRDIVAISMIGELFNLVAVSTGGDLVKAFYLNRAISSADNRKNLGLVVFSVFLDRVIGLFGLFFFGMLVCLLAWPTIGSDENLRRMTAAVAVICAGLLLGFFVLASETLEHSPLRKRLMAKLPFHQKIEHIYEGFSGLRHHKTILLAMLGLSLLTQFSVCMIVLTLSRDMTFTSVATGAPAPLETIPCLTVLPLGMFLNTFGMAGGFGVGNLAFEKLFNTMLGLKGGAGLILSFQIVSVFFRLSGFPFLLLYRNRNDAPPK